jgi:hypothetical protein
MKTKIEKNEISLNNKKDGICLNKTETEEKEMTNKFNRKKNQKSQSLNEQLLQNLIIKPYLKQEEA